MDDTVSRLGDMRLDRPEGGARFYPPQDQDNQPAVEPQAPRAMRPSTFEACASALQQRYQSSRNRLNNNTAASSDNSFVTPQPTAPATTTSTSTQTPDPSITPRALFLLRLPHGVTPTTILSSIRGYDKVRSLTITHKPGPPSRRTRPTAELQFFTHAANERFFKDTSKGFQVGGHKIRVAWSSKPADEEYPVNDATRDHSRVLRVVGERGVFSLGEIMGLLANHREFGGVCVEVEKVVDVLVGEGYVGYEIHLVSFAPDAQIAWMVLSRKLGERGVGVGFGRDPCA